MKILEIIAQLFFLMIFLFLDVVCFVLAFWEVPVSLVALAPASIATYMTIIVIIDGIDLLKE